MTKNVTWHSGAVTARDRHAISGGPGVTVWLTGLSGSGKSTIAVQVEVDLVLRGRAAYTLDGDNLRLGLNADLGFYAEDRFENVRRIGEVARLMADAGLVVLVPVISPFLAGRDQVRAAHLEAGIPFVEVYVATPLAVCEERDPKGLYAMARAGEIAEFTGVSSPYEAPVDADLVIRTEGTSIASSAELVLVAIREVSGLNDGD